MLHSIIYKALELLIIAYRTIIVYIFNEKISESAKKSIIDCIRNNNIEEEINLIISIIIPSYNEGKNINATIDKLIKENDNNIEIIVCDGGSNDNTISILNEIKKQSKVNIEIIENAGNNRSSCLNKGASIAIGTILLFLHADTLLPENFAISIRNCIQNSKINTNFVAGCFKFNLTLNDKSVTFYEKNALNFLIFWTNIRSKYFQHPYGDQALFFRRKTFNLLGGFPKVEFMEDYDLMLKARSFGTIENLGISIATSARRWQKFGIIRNTLKNQLIIYSRTIGISHHTCGKWYYGKTSKKEYS